MCNAWNHSLGCTCGWGGNGHRGRSPGGWPHRGGYASASDVTNYKPNGYRWRYYEDDFCRPTHCPICGAEVFFVRHNGGSVWFDALGKPWPKHACFDTPHSPSRLYYFSSQYGWNSTYGVHQRLLRYANEQQAASLGVVIEGEIRPEQREDRLTFRCANGKIYHVYIAANYDIKKLIGEFILVSGKTMKMVFISLGEVVPFQKQPTPTPEEFVVGATYRHHTFGLGTLLSAQATGNDVRVVVDFEDIGVTNLLASYANLHRVPPQS